jgi:prophage tail gpP-like protein
MVTKREETAVLTVNGRKFQDWDSVSVKHELGARPTYLCRFTCSEPLPIANNFAKLQIKPGDQCTVTLAGYPAFTGKVMTRQVFYDAHRHHIEIQAGTFSELSTAAVPSQTGEWKNQTFQQIAKDILGKAKINLVFEGGAPPAYKFPRASSSPGETISDFLETYARGLGASGAMSFTSNERGDFVVVMGPSGGTDTVREGHEILIGREIIYNESMANSVPAVSQGSGDDSKWGAAVAHAPFASIPFGTVFGNQLPGRIFSELPTSDISALKSRAMSETNWMKDSQVSVIVTLYGWQRPSGGLWQRNQTVIVNSEMLMMKNEKLTAKSVTFSQDNRGGTRTTLDLRNHLGNAPSVPSG